MPELPEVEAFKSYIESNCLNKTIEQVQSSDTKIIKKITFAKFKKELIGNKFSKVERYGKYLVIDTKPANLKLVLHFALTGSLEFLKKSNSKVKYWVVQFIFKDGSTLFFKSIRKFEKIWLTKKIQDIKGIAELGPDALKLTLKEFLDIMQTHNAKNIKAVLMNQKIISGIGNEYADEILYQSGIDPHHSIKDLSQTQLKTVYKQINKVLKYAIKIRRENKAFASTYLQAHRHTDQLCPKDKKQKLKKATIAGRTSYYCPNIQK